jgi:hypothetical protein
LAIIPIIWSAIGAPTRALWMVLGTVYAALMIGFGWILWRSSRSNRALRVVGVLLMTQTVFGYFWPPMHQRAVLAAGGGTLTDTLHLAWVTATGLFFLVAMGFGAAALGRRFRAYSIVTMAIIVACGAKPRAGPTSHERGFVERIGWEAGIRILRTRLSNLVMTRDFWF